MSKVAQDDSEMSDISEADAEDLLNSLKNIDDLEAELFGPKKTTPTKNKKNEIKSQSRVEKKKVSFGDSVLTDTKQRDTSTASTKVSKSSRRRGDDLDFDLDDPLAGLLSDEDEDLMPPTSAQSSPVKSGGRKDSTANDWLFDDDDDADDLLDDGGGENKKQKTKIEKEPRLSVQSLMKPSVTNDSSSTGKKKMTLDDFASNAAKFSPEKNASPYGAAPSTSTKKDIAFDDEFGFGSYQPTLATPTETSRKGRTRKVSSEAADFFDFLKEEEEDEETVQPQRQERVQSPTPKPAATSRRLDTPSRPRTADVPSTQVNIEGNKRPRPRSSDNARKPPASRQEQSHEKKPVIYDTPILPGTEENKENKKQQIDDQIASTSRTPPPLSGQPPRPSRRNAGSPFIGGVQSPLPSQQLLSPATANIPDPVHLPYRTTDTTYSMGPIVGDESRLQAADSQISHSRAILHSSELGYKADLEIMKTAYDSRLELLRSSFDDLRSRIDRELESVRESYSARIDVLRQAMQSQVHAETSKECDHQDEIKRLRNLHLQALEECRRDGEIQVTRLQEAHVTEIEAVKNSTFHARNIESMMSRVDEATTNLQQLSSKYESAYRAVTQQSESVSLGNKQLISVMQNQLSQQQRSTSDAQIQLQQTASRLEGMVSEMNRKMEEQHYSMQLSHSNLQSAHAALQEERKQFMQQITLEREHLRKAHREMINLQGTTQQDAREDRSKLLRAVDDLTSSVARYEEAKVDESERTRLRNQEHEDKMNQMNNEKMELAKRRAQLETAESKLESREVDLNKNLSQFDGEKRILEQIQNDLEQREAEMQMLAQRAIQSGTDNERALAEAKRIEDGQSQKMAAIHGEMKEVANQRQLLAEERKSLALERSSGGQGSLVPAMTSSPISHATPSSAVTPSKRPLMIGHPGSPGQASGATVVLWRHTAQQDHSFLEDEQFFLETLKNSPYGKKK